jgi:hypothetical protein
MKSLAISLFATAVTADKIPNAIFHGLGDSCSHGGMAGFAEDINLETGAYSKCLEIGNGSETSVFMNMEK